MTPDQWSRMVDLFDAVLALPAEERRAYLDRACPDDAAVREEVERLLHYDGASPDPLAQAPVRGMLADAAPQDLSGRRIGPYRLLRRIATGGMGEVYLGLRADREFEQRVAIKLVRRGMDSEGVLRRFRRERQTLANMAHPNIAKVFHGGMTEDGRPYLVMEYIEGVPIDEYCDSQRLSIRQRLQMFRTVCSAVQSAHENLVVHRDIKPTNILVTAGGTPTLLDFGIARVLAADGSESDGERTATEARVLTPEYASPEQIRGGPIATTSDVYSLGVVLYELLTGVRPHTTKGRTSAEAERIVCEQEPAKPSTVIIENSQRTGTTHAAHRRRELRGDLDTIALKALRKEPERRYRSVDQLSDDVERYLRGQPISARKDTLSYRFTKFVKRNKPGVAAAAVIALVVVGAMAGIASQARSARDAARLAAHQAAVAKAEARTAQRVTKLLIGLFEESDPMISPKEPTLREILDRSVARVENELSDEPAIKAELLCILGSVYQHLGQLAKAEHLYQRAMAIRQESFGPDSVEVALSLNNLGVVDIDRSNFSSAVERLEQAARIYARAIEHQDGVLRLYRENRTDVTRKGYATALANLGLARVSAGDLAGAEPVLQRGLELIDQLALEDVKLHTSALEALATIHFQNGGLTKAADLFRESLQRRMDYYGDDHPLVAIATNNLAIVLMEQGKFSEAAPLLERSLEIREMTYGDEHPALVAALANLGKVYSRLGNYDVAESHLRQSLALAGRVLPERHASLAKVSYNLAMVLVEQPELEAAERFLREAIDLWTATRGREHIDAAKCLNGLGRCLTGLHRLDEAEAAVEEAISIARRIPGSGAQVMHEALRNLAAIDMARQQYGQAEERLREALDICGETLGDRHPVAGLLRSDLGWALYRQGKRGEAEAELRRAIAVQRAALGADHPHAAVTSERLGTLTSNAEPD